MMIHNKRNQRIALIAILLIGAFLRFYRLGAKSLWLDEAFTLWVANHSFGDVWNWIARIDQHPPLFYLLLSGWVKLFGDSEITIRALPALLGTLTLPLFYATARRIAPPTTALLALLLLAINPFHIDYAQDTRMYTLLTFAGCGAIYFMLRLVGDERVGNWRLGNWGLSDWNVVGLAIFQAIGMWTHNTFVIFFPLAILIGLAAAQLYSAFRIPHSALRKLLTAQLLALLLWSPWLVNFVRQSLKVDAEFWIRPLSLGQIYDTLRRLLFDHFTLAPVTALCILLAIFCAFVGFAKLSRENKIAGNLLLSFWLTPFLAEIVLSLRRPLLHAPSLIWSTIPLYLLVAIGMATALQRWQGIRQKLVAGVLILMLCVQAIGLNNYYLYAQREAWAEVAQFVSERATAKRSHPFQRHLGAVAL